MGDITTHPVKHRGYWYLAFVDHGYYIDSAERLPLCATSDAEAAVKLYAGDRS